MSREVVMRLTPKPLEDAEHAEIVQELVRCKDCKWGKERCGNIECNVDMNEPSEYHGYEWFCPCGERREDEKRRKRTDSESCTENA